VNDPIETTLTTQGYLSDGNSHPISLNGENGDDLFDVLRNKQLIDLNGGSGDDIFTVRSFVALEVALNGSLSAPLLGELSLVGGDGSDTFDFKGEDPDYVTNSLVDVGKKPT
jgi:Ca2+-binding RTX toxin-like protein